MNKWILKIAGIIAILMGVGWCLSIVGILVGILLIIGGFKVIEYSNMTDDEIMENKDSILCWSVFFLFFTIFSGILGILFYFMVSLNISNRRINYIDEIKKLDELRKSGIISDKEFEAKKKKILDL